ncbi:MAG TPA: hypothetical protein VN132_12775, partial [Bdellovibrio sp.]|nr:hypothetical protein [Bdellovibrio sp.]
PDYKSVSNAVNAPLMFSSSDKKTAQAVTPLVLGGAVPSSTASTNVPKKTTVQDAPAPTGPQCDSEHYNATDFPGAHIKWFGFYHTSSTGVTTPGLADSNGVNDSRNTVRTMKAQQIPFNMTWTQEGTVDQLIARIQEAHDLDLKIIVEVTPLFYDQPQAGVFYLKPGNNKPKVTCLGAGTGPQAISADTKDQYWSTPEWDDFVTKLKGANLEDTILAFYPLDEPFNHNSDWTTEVQNLEAIADRIRLDFPDVTRFPIATTFALDKVLNSKFRLPRNFTWFSFDQYGGPWDHQVAAGLGVKLGISNANLGHMIEIFEGKVLGTKKRSCDGSGTTFNDDPLIRTFLTLDAFSFNGPKVPETPLVDEGEFQRLWLKDRQTYMYGVCKPRVVGIIPFMYPSVRGHDTLTGVKDLQGTSGKLIDEYTTFIGKNIVDLYQKHKNDPAKTTYDP